MNTPVNLTQEEKVLYARAKDAVDWAARKNEAKFIGFLDARQQEIVSMAVGKAGLANGSFYGGFEEAERRIAGFFPDYVEKEDWESLFPVQVIGISFRKQDRITHRDVLGSLMALGIERETIGDILVGEGRAYVCVLSKIAGYIVDELEQIGRVGVKLSAGADGIEDLAPRLAPLTGTISSNRIDAVVAFLTRLSREKAQQLIQKELVRLNYGICTRVADEVSENDILSVRGYGKYKVLSFGGTTKKGRLHITAGIYQ